MPTVLDLNESIESMLKMLKRLIGEDIELIWQPGPGLAPIKIDPSQIDQILANLCVNSRDAIDGIGKITIQTSNCSFDQDFCDGNPDFQPGQFVCLTLSDSGCGMSKETLSKIFEPFFTTKELGQGTGLGLATVYGVMKQNHGFIHVTSEVDHGSVFMLFFPQCDEKEWKKEEDDIATVSRGNQEKILIVEDDPAILVMTETILEQLGYQIHGTQDPGEALTLAQSMDRIDLLITDVIMPGMNGRELASQLQTHFPSLDILFMSGYTANVIAHHGVLDEGVHFIQKPFSYHDLAVRVRKILDHDS